MTVASRDGERGGCLRVAHSFIKPGAPLDDVGARLANLDCELVELDVLTRDGDLVVAHDAKDLEDPDLFSLGAALSELAEHLPREVGLIVDLKRAGYEQGVVDALREHGLAERALISTMEVGSLRLIRARAPEIRLGWSVPRVTPRHLANPVNKAASYAFFAASRSVLPRRARREIAAGHIDAVMANWRMVTGRLVRAVDEAGGELYAWTLKTEAQLRAMDRLGVTGVIADDTSLFERLSRS